MYAVTHEGMARPYRSPTARGALKIARSFTYQGMENIRVFSDSGEPLSLSALALRFGEESQVK